MMAAKYFTFKCHLFVTPWCAKAFRVTKMSLLVNMSMEFGMKDRKIIVIDHSLAFLV